jgi:hypothetical protein
MSRLKTWASGFAGLAVATSAIIGACHNQVPGPSAPLPPTREVSPQGPRPGPITPLKPAEPKKPIQTIIGGAAEGQAVDAGIEDALELPPLPDGDIQLDAPIDKK